ncbi:hypothetical protein ACRAWD_21465 [Caulobacter segnis]
MAIDTGARAYCVKAGFTAAQCQSSFRRRPPVGDRQSRRGREDPPPSTACLMVLPSRSSPCRPWT